MYPTPQLYYNLSGLSYFQEVILSNSPNLAEVKNAVVCKPGAQKSYLFKINTI